MLTDFLDSFCKTDANPASLDIKLQRLPKSLSESLEALKKDDFLHKLIGEKLLVAIKGVRKVCLEFFFSMVFSN